MMSLLVYFLTKSRFLHVSWPVSVKKVPTTIQKPKKTTFFYFHRRPLFPASTDPKYPQNFLGALRAETEKKSFFPIFTPNPIIHYTKNPIIVSNWSRYWIRKSKKVIFQSKPSYPEPWSLLVAFSKKSRFPHVSWPVFVKKSPSNDSKSEKNQLFPIFDVDHFSRLLQTQNTPTIFLGRFAQKLKKDHFSRFSP